MRQERAYRENSFLFEAEQNSTLYYIRFVGDEKIFLSSYTSPRLSLTYYLFESERDKSQGSSQPTTGSLCLYCQCRSLFSLRLLFLKTREKDTFSSIVCPSDLKSVKRVVDRIITFFPLGMSFHPDLSRFGMNPIPPLITRRSSGHRYVGLRLLSSRNL